MKKLVSFAIIFTVLLSATPKAVAAIEVSAKAAVVINGDTGEVIYAKNMDQKLPMASTTKIMTGLLLCEGFDLNREITVTDQMVRVEGSSMGLVGGDKITLHDLLYGLMLASGNDAANVIAYILAGNPTDFAKMMNQKAKEIGLKNTNFVTPSGLDDEEHYTTAYDLALLTKYAMQNSTFAEVVSCKTATLCYGNPPYKRTLTNHNKLLKSFEGCVGVKTGFTKKSGRCLVSAAKRDGKFVIAVTLNAPNDWQDHTQMLEYGISKIIQTEIAPKKQDYQISVIGGIKQKINLSVKPFIINSTQSEGFTCEVLLPVYAFAPIKKGDVLGYAIYKQNGVIMAENEILAECDVPLQKEKKKRITEILDNFLYIAKFI